MCNRYEKIICGYFIGKFPNCAKCKSATAQKPTTQAMSGGNSDARGGAGKASFWDKFNLFPEYEEKEDHRIRKHGCRQTAIFGTVVLALMLSLTIYYSLRKLTITKTVSNPSASEAIELFRAGYTPYCECKNSLQQKGSIANVSFTRDQLCVEIEHAWPIVKANLGSTGTQYWDQTVFKNVLKGLFDLCGVVIRVGDGALNRWNGEFISNNVLLDPEDVTSMFADEAQTLTSSIADGVATIVDIYSTSIATDAPAAYSIDAMPLPSKYEDLWRWFVNITVHDRYTVISLSKLASEFKNQTLNYTKHCVGTQLYSSDPVLEGLTIDDRHMQCYFATFTGTVCQDDFDVMMNLITPSRGCVPGDACFQSLVGVTADVYCSAMQTLLNYPTAALTSEDFWSWSGLGDSAFGNKLNVSQFQNISEALAQGFITNTTQSSSYDAYFSQCEPKRCTYTTEERLDSAAIALIVFGLLGGFVSALQVLVPMVCSPCAPSGDDDDKDNNGVGESPDVLERGTDTKTSKRGTGGDAMHVFELVQKLQDQLRKQQDVLNDHVRRTAVVSPEPATSSVTSGRSPIVGEPVGSSVDPQFARIGVASPAAGARSGDGGDGPASPEPGQTAAEGRGLLGRGDDAKQIQSPPPPAYDS